MKKLSVLVLVPLLAGSALMAGKNTAPVEAEVIEIPKPMKVEEDKPGPLYVRGMVGMVKGDDVARGGSYDVNAASIALGYNLFKYIGVESRAVKSMKENASAGDYAFSNVAVYAKPQITFMESVTLYGLVGYGLTKVEKDEADMLQWGAGVEYMLNDTLGFSADYTRVYDDDTFDTTTTNDATNVFSIGVVVKL